MVGVDSEREMPSVAIQGVSFVVEMAAVGVVCSFIGRGEKIVEHDARLSVVLYLHQHTAPLGVGTSVFLGGCSGVMDACFQFICDAPTSRAQWLRFDFIFFFISFLRVREDACRWGSNPAKGVVPRASH